MRWLSTAARAVLLASPAPIAVGAAIALRARAEAARQSAARAMLADTLTEHLARGERARIARELHDVVAHHISVIAVQAETARLTTPGLPAAGAQRFAEIGDTARAGLTEMRRLLGVLREDAEGAVGDRQPQPGLAQLAELIDGAREASGGGARLIVSGPVAPFDPGVELAAYRIVQEALTNARRHAPGAAVDVELCYQGRAATAGQGQRPGPGASAPSVGGGAGPRAARHARAGRHGRRVAAHRPRPRRRVPGRGRAAGQAGGDMTAATAIGIVVADDHEVVRAGFAALLDTQPDFTVLGTAADGAEAVRVCRSARPDVVLMDVRMPGTDGIEATRQLALDAEHTPRVLILTTFDLDEYVFDALRAGASGFLLKDAPPSGCSRGSGSSRPATPCSRRAITRRLISELRAASAERCGGRAGPPAASAAVGRSPHGKRRCSGRSPRGCPTRRSRGGCTCLRRPSRPTSAGSWANSASGAGPRPSSPLTRPGWSSRPGRDKASAGEISRAASTAKGCSLSAALQAGRGAG